MKNKLIAQIDASSAGAHAQPPAGALTSAQSTGKSQVQVLVSVLLVVYKCNVGGMLALCANF